MRYIIQCGDGYIGSETSGIYIYTTDKSIMRIFDSEKKANNVMNTLPKLLKEKGVTILEYHDEKINSQYISVDMDNVKELINNLSEQFTAMKGNKEWLIDMLSEIDQEISDILHYIEFYSFSACDGYKLAKELKTLRLKRRDIKNQLDAINIITTHSCNMIALGTTNKALCNIDNKQYTPRILKEMFESKQK